MGRLHSYGAVEPQQRTELVLNDSANVGTAHYCEGRDSFWKSPLSSGGGGGQLLICLFHYLYMPALEVASYMGYSVFNEQHRELSNKSHV